MSHSAPQRPKRRRRARELALQALFILDHQRLSFRDLPRAPFVAQVLTRLRERALVSELSEQVEARHEGRLQEALKALKASFPEHAYAAEVQAFVDKTGPAPLPLTPDDHEENEGLRGSDQALQFASILVHGVLQDLQQIDARIQRASTNWRLHRMALVDRNILRIGTFELQTQEDSPTRVILNEAIEVAKRYGTTESGAFVNGILDKIATELGRQTRR